MEPKPFKAIDDQISILRERGMEIHNVEFGVKGQNVCLARRVAGVRFGLFECRLSGCSRCR